MMKSVQGAAPTADCHVRLVEDTTVTDYTAVQAAIDAATTPSATVMVAGTCVEINHHGDLTQVVYLSKTLTLLGGYSADFSVRDPELYPTTLDAQSQGRVMVITGTGIAPIIEGLHLTGGDATGLKVYVEKWLRDVGGGVYVNRADPVSVPWSARDVWLGVGAFGVWLAAAFGFVFLAQSLSWQIDVGVFVTLWELALVVPAWWLTVRKYEVEWSALGLIFAYLYHRSGSIWPAVVMHVLTNGIGLGAAYLASQMDLPVGL